MHWKHSEKSWNHLQELQAAAVLSGEKLRLVVLPGFSLLCWANAPETRLWRLLQWCWRCSSHGQHQAALTSFRTAVASTKWLLSGRDPGWWGHPGCFPMVFECSQDFVAKIAMSPQSHLSHLIFELWFLNPIIFAWWSPYSQDGGVFLRIWNPRNHLELRPTWHKADMGYGGLIIGYPLII